MPGIAGIVCADGPDPGAVAEAMAKLQCWGNGATTERLSMTGVGFARCRADAARFESPLCEDREAGLLVALDGFVTDLAPLRAMTPDTAASAGAARLLLDAYLKRGIAALGALRGQFSAAVWDGQARALHLASDKAGARNLYWMRVGNLFIFSSQMKSLLAVPGVELRPDDVGTAEYLTFGYATGDLTLFRDVHLLRPGRILSFDGSKVSISQYWKPHVREGDAVRPLPEAAEHLHHCLKVAHERCVGPARSIGLGLSGGRDSRLIAGYLAMLGVERREGYAFDIGARGESHIAALVAAACGMAVREVDLKIEDYIRQKEECSWLTEGGINSCEFLNVARAAAGGVDAMTWGFAGDTLSGRPISPLFYTARNRDELLPLYFRTDPGPMLGEHRHAEALHPDFHRRVAGAVREHYWRLFSEYDAVEPVNLWTLHDFCHRQRRRTMRVVSISEHFLPTVYPFLDDDVIECFLAMPVRYKKYQRAYGEVMSRFFPKLAAIRCGEYNISMGRELRLMPYIQLARRVKRYVKSLFPGRVPPRFSAVDYLYAEGFKRELHGFAQECLLSLSRDRHILDEKFALGVLDRHVSGQENAHYLLLKLTTLEVFFRQMLERQTPTPPAPAVGT